MANRVMVVEDEHLIRKYADMTLTKAGYEVVTVPDAEAAMAAYRPGMYDCLVVDFFLGGGETGIDLIKKIREKDQKVGIVMATGTIDVTELAVDGLSVWACLHKPYEQDDLARKVGEACELSRMDEGTKESIGIKMDQQTDRLRKLRTDLRNETTVLPPGAIR